jgi:hypothetical protein
MVEITYVGIIPCQVLLSSERLRKVIDRYMSLILGLFVAIFALKCYFSCSCRSSCQFAVVLLHLPYLIPIIFYFDFCTIPPRPSIEAVLIQNIEMLTPLMARFWGKIEKGMLARTVWRVTVWRFWNVNKTGFFRRGEIFRCLFKMFKKMIPLVDILRIEYIW